MLYESDINKLLSNWEASLKSHTEDYRIAIRDCIYDLRCLMNKQHDEEMLYEEVVEQQLPNDAEYWNSYFEQLTYDGIFA